MKTTGFETLLARFSKISAIQFEIWNEQGSILGPDLLGSSQDDRSWVKDFLPGMAARVYEEKKFCHRKAKTHVQLFGLPLINDEIVEAALLAYACIPLNSEKKDGLVCEDVQAILIQLAELIEEKWDLQNESEMMIQELDKSYETLHLYSNVVPQIKTLNFSNQMIVQLIKEIRDNLAMDMAFSIIPDRPTFSEVVCRQEKPIKDKINFALSLIRGIETGHHSLNGGYFIVNNSCEIHPFSSLHPDPFRFLAVKIQHAGKFYGWLGILSFNMESIIERSQLRLLISIAEQCCVVIANTDLYQDLENFSINMVKSLIFTIEAKDFYTRGHSERVHYYSMLMAQEQGLIPEELKILNWSALLHDIGKIGIPEEILNKPGSLDDKEYDVIKTHPEKGVEILTPLSPLSHALPGILHHHERYDGKGYPHRLSGDDIPLFSRIISVADTFDAITSDRAYRKGQPHEKGLKIINKVAGTQLDPEQVRMFNTIYPTANLSLKRAEQLI